MERTVYHFVYCLREIHLEREIDIKIIRKYNLIENLWKFWNDTFSSRESIYLVDYINVVLVKYPSLINTLKIDELLTKLMNSDKINEFSVVHQGLILEIVAKIMPRLDQNIKQQFIRT